MGWSSSAVAIGILRDILFDNASDRLCANKKVIGTIDGTNLIFKTFEYKRTTNFTTAVFPLGLFKDGVQLALNKITSDDVATGVFKIDSSVVPSGRSAITATYYFQVWVDAELDNYLQNASNWLGYGSTYTNLPDGLNASALDFSAREAYRAAAMKYTQQMSDVYKLEDADVDSMTKAIDTFRSLAKDFMETSKELRDDFYTRQGQSLSPLFNLSLGKVTDPTPRR